MIYKKYFKPNNLLLFIGIIIFLLLIHFSTNNAFSDTKNNLTTKVKNSPLKSSENFSKSLIISTPSTKPSSTIKPTKSLSITNSIISVSKTPLSDIKTPENSVSTTLSPIQTPIPSCNINISSNFKAEIEYKIQNDWKTGCSVIISIINKSNAVINNWSLSWSYKNVQVITELWSANLINDNSNILVTSNYNNSTIIPDSSVSFGFYLSYKDENEIPDNFILNNIPCCLIQN
jgi:hypothetical protein